MGKIKNIHGEQIKDLITKFFYRNNHLCFQILIHTEWNETITLGEFSDYSKYKKAFNDLQDARTKKVALNIPEKKLQAEVNSVKEPRLPLMLCFILGIASTAPAIFLEKWGQSFGWDDPTHIGLTLLYSFIGIALVEELVKFVAVMVYSYHRPFFNEPMDGIVYTVMVGMGFATLENIYYAYSFGLQTTLVRAFTAVPAHAAFAIIMGYYIGLSKFDPSKRIQLLSTGFLLAVFFHGAYDFFLIQELYEGLTVLAIVTLFLSIRYSKKFIRLHQENSPFKGEPIVMNKEETLP